jgi:hypothetical protein
MEVEVWIGMIEEAGLIAWDLFGGGGGRGH